MGSDAMDVDKTDFLSLPNELILDILVYLPGPTLKNLAKLRNKRLTALCMSTSTLENRIAIFRNARLIKEAITNATDRLWIEDAAYLCIKWDQKYYQSHQRYNQIARLIRHWGVLKLPATISSSIMLNTGIFDSPNPLDWLHKLNHVLKTQLNDKFTQNPSEQKANVHERDLDAVETQAAALGLTLPPTFAKLMRSREQIDTLPNPISVEPLSLCLASGLRRVHLPMIYVNREEKPAGHAEDPSVTGPRPQSSLLDGYLLRFARYAPRPRRRVRWFNLFLGVEGQGQCVLISYFDPCGLPVLPLDPETGVSFSTRVDAGTGSSPSSSSTNTGSGSSTSTNTTPSPICIFRGPRMPAHFDTNDLMVQTPLSDLDRELGIEGYTNSKDRADMHGFFLGGLSFEEWIVMSVYCACAKVLVEQGYALPRCLEHFIAGSHTRYGQTILATGDELSEWGLLADEGENDEEEDE